MDVDRWDRLFGKFVRVYAGVLVPFCFVWAFTSVVDMASGANVLIRPWQYPVILLAGLGKLALDRVLRLEKLSFFTVFREVILVTAGVIGLSLLLSLGAEAIDGVPAEFQTVYLCLALTAQWFLTFHLDRLFLEHRRLKDFIEGDAAREEHPETLKRSALIGDMGMVLRRLRYSMVALAAAYIITLAAVGWITGTLGPVAVAAAGVFLTAVFFAVLCLNILGDEHRRYSEGLFTPLGGKRSRLLAVLPVLAVSIVIALLAAGSRPLIDLSGLRLVPPSALPDGAPPPASPFELPLEKSWLDFFRSAFPLEKPSPFWLGLNRALLILAGAAGLIFILLPVFSRRFRNLFIRGRWGAFLKKMAGRFRDWLVWLAAALREGWRRLSGKSRDMDTDRRAGDGVTEGRWAQSGTQHIRMREANRLVRYFRRLQRWSAGKKLPYRHGQTAAEYLDAIAGRYPDERERLGVILDVFERGLFSNRMLSRDDWHRYGNSIHAVTRLR